MMLAGSSRIAAAGPLDELGRARIDLLQAEIEFAERRGGDAPLLLLEAAKKLQPLDLRLARNTYLDSWGAALSPATSPVPVAHCSTSRGPR